MPQPLAIPPFPSPCLLNLSVASIRPPPLAVVLPDAFLPATTSPKVILFVGGANLANLFSFGVIYHIIRLISDTIILITLL